MAVPAASAHASRVACVRSALHGVRPPDAQRQRGRGRARSHRASISIRRGRRVYRRRPRASSARRREGRDCFGGARRRAMGAKQLPGGLVHTARPQGARPPRTGVRIDPAATDRRGRPALCLRRSRHPRHESRLRRVVRRRSEDRRCGCRSRRRKRRSRVCRGASLSRRRRRSYRGDRHARQRGRARRRRIDSVGNLHDLLHSGTVFYAALTGVLLWLSSLGAGWLENWIVYRRLPEALAKHRRLLRLVVRYAPSGSHTPSARAQPLSAEA